MNKYIHTCSSAAQFSHPDTRPRDRRSPGAYLRTSLDSAGRSRSPSVLSMRLSESDRRHLLKRRTVMQPDRANVNTVDINLARRRFQNSEQRKEELGRGGGVEKEQDTSWITKTHRRLSSTGPPNDTNLFLRFLVGRTSEPTLRVRLKTRTIINEMSFNTKSSSGRYLIEYSLQRRVSSFTQTHTLQDPPELDLTSPRPPSRAASDPSTREAPRAANHSRNA